MIEGEALLELLRETPVERAIREERGGPRPARPPAPPPPRYEPVRMTPSPEAVAAAKLRQDVEREELGYGIFDGIAWPGYLFEVAAAAWLERNGCDVKLNGGFDALPDIEVNGYGIGCKGRGIEPKYVDDPYALVPITHLDKSWDWWLFGAVVMEEPHTTWVMGAMTPGEFRSLENHPDPRKRTVLEDWGRAATFGEKAYCRYLHANRGQLVTPADWLRLIAE